MLASSNEAVGEGGGMGVTSLKEQQAAAGSAAGGSGGGGEGKRKTNKGKSKSQSQSKAPVREETLVHASKALEEFLASDAQAYEFESGMSIAERRAIHKMCTKMGMKSKSSGPGEKRHVCVYKIDPKKESLVDYKPAKQSHNKKHKKEPDMKEVKKEPDIEEGPSHLEVLSEEARHVLQDLFTHYPPDDADLTVDAVKNSSYKAAKIKFKDNAFGKPAFTKSTIAEMIQRLTSKMNRSPEFRKIVENRSKLPISSFQDVISSTLENHQVVLISGEPGCGKTTQVPQFILDYMWGKGESCKIICTQPRRISAISVAERISAERGESIGDTVGYKIRLESKGGKNSSIMFCTNGILLRMLVGRGTNSTQCSEHVGGDAILGITHVIVDEIHERDRFSDFMLTILRDLLPLYPHLRLVLMSATLDADRFTKYFDGCPVIQIPGFTYPVKTFYLEDVLSILHYAGDNHLNSTSSGLKQKCALTEDLKSSMDESINLALVNDEFDPLLELISAEQNLEIYNYHHSETGVTPLMVFAAKGQLGDVCMLLSCGVDYSAQDHNGKSALDWAEQENQKMVCEVIRKHKSTELLDKYLATVNPENIDAVLIQRLLGKICVDSSEGAILVFLPGWEDINRTREVLLASPFFRNPSKFLVLPLHSMIPSDEQKNVFKRPPAGVRKIILSTNIAESSVTIDDVVYVIDSGRMKEKSYDPYNNISTLCSSWISKASARQREGRAGRCQPGTCYHLYSRFRESSLPEYRTPEMKRMPIEELCLQIRLFDSNCSIADFLKKTLDPPIPESLSNAITVLKNLGALTQDEELTEFGEKIGSLPVHPTTAKMLLFAILMNCLDPALTLACAADFRDPFDSLEAPDDKMRVAAAKVELASLYGGFSDQLAIVAAFDCWKHAKDKGQEFEFCRKYFLSSNTMTMLKMMREQLRNELSQRGFVPEDKCACSLNSKDPGIMRAVLMASAYPMVGRFLPRERNDKKPMVDTVSGAKFRLNDRKPMVDTASGTKVRLNPRSCNYNIKPSGNPLVIFDEVTRGDNGMYIRNCSIAGLHPLFLLATEIVVAPSSSVQHKEEIMSSPDNTVTVVIDRWLRFDAMALDVAQIYCLRERLASAIHFKVQNPREVLPPALRASMYAIACFLSYSYDGLPAVVQSNDLSSNQASDLGKGVGYIPPGGYLLSLLEDGTGFQKSSNHPGGASRRIRPSRPTVWRFD